MAVVNWNYQFTMVDMGDTDAKMMVEYLQQVILGRH